MRGNIREIYKVNKSEIESSFERQMGLKMDPEYEKWANNIACDLIEYFSDKYPKVKIEIPKLREKSAKSLLGKIKNLQIERLSKLYCLGNITDKNKRDLYELVKERIDENNKLNEVKILLTIKDLLFGNDIHISRFEKNLMVDGISNSTKTALLRILMGKIERSNHPNKEKYIKRIDEKYGTACAKKTNNPENNILRYESINTLKENPDKIERLKDDTQFLKANDLRGMKIVATYIPDDFITDNEEIKKLLEQRKLAQSKEEERKYTRLAIVELGKEFYNDLANDEEFLNKIGLNVIPDSNKHKRKTNGYEAEHIKFYGSSNPEYTLEMQFKSEDVENITRANGSASHEKRPGKSRILPCSENDKDLKKKLEYQVPI